MLQTINQHLGNVTLDIRKMTDARFLDQKCTPDVVCFIAECIVNSIKLNQSFTKEDIWNDQYFIRQSQAVFGKPAPTDHSAAREYDKFIGQPLRLLSYAKILNLTKTNRRNYYKINKYDILEYISRREYNAFEFLSAYVDKLLTDSNLMRFFDTYKNAHKNNSISQEVYKELKTNFEKYIHGNTKINNKYEPARIFPKILNVYAVKNGLRGSISGHISKNVFVYSDLMYNRVNWRDVNKAKSKTRQQSAQNSIITTQRQIYNAYIVQRAKNTLKRIQKSVSELHDQYGSGIATHAHHIFPGSLFPQIAAYLENLILLTAAQHTQRAHPNGNTQIIDRSYQQACLLSKANTIEDSIQKVGPRDYSKSNFLYVIKEGFNLPQEWSSNLSFDQIRDEIVLYYQNHP